VTDDLQEFVAHALTDIEGKAVTAVINVPVPPAPLSVFLGAFERDMSVLWDTGSPADAFATAGSTHRIDLSGANRFAQMSVEVSAVWRRTVVRSHPDCKDPAPPRMFGGFAFAPGAADAAPWEAFGDGCLALPRWSYARNQGNSVLSVSARGEACDLAHRQRLLDELHTVLEAIESHRGVRTYQHLLTLPSIPPGDVRQLDYAAWCTHIDTIRAAIRAGEFAKIVAARRADVALQKPIDDIEALSRLVTEQACTRFAFRRASTSFLGATPETLFSKRGDMLTTHALAGTIRSLGSDLPGLSARTTELLSSDKDLREHRFVVHEICRSLAPLALSVDTPRSPVVRRLRSILHLDTPIQALLRAGTDAADLVSALHPTPAVGGVPREGSANWIAKHEAVPRGWYSGPVGWVDLRGDATFAVALRCGLLTTGYAYAFAGAGIVADSQTQAEYEETELKQLPFLRAVGVVL